jgi:arginase
MDVTVVTVPYDTGLRAYRMGAGPQALVAAGLPDRLAAAGRAVIVEEVAPQTEPTAEIRTAFELMRGVSTRVRAAAAAGHFPVILSGNCSASVGTLGGLGGGAAVVWFDAHGDFNTPDITTTGFLDGTPLAIAAGRCWHALAATVPGFRPVAERDIVLAGARDLDPAERDALSSSDVAFVPPEAIRTGALASALNGIADRAPAAYLHVDLDVLDPDFGRANTFAAPGGLRPDELLTAVSEVATRLRVRALGIASYDPAADRDGRVAAVALDLADAVVSHAHPEASQADRPTP